MWIKENVAGLERAHFEPRKSNVTITRNYNRKGQQSHEEWIQFGTKGPNWGLNADWISFGKPRQGQGTRTDLVALKAMIDEGKSMKEIADADFPAFSRLYKAILAYKMLIRPERKDSIQVILIHGPPECGKTRWAYTQYPDLWEPAVTTQGLSWFDGYDGHKVVLLDEFEGTVYKFSGSTKF